METALSITLFCALDSGISKDDALLSVILEHMHAQSSSNTSSASSFPQQAQKRQRREQDEACPFTNILQSCVMASFMFPSHTTSTSTMDRKNPRTRLQDCFKPFPCPKRRIRGIRWWRERFENHLILILLLLLLGTRRKYQVEQYHHGLIAYWNNMWWIIHRGHFYKNECINIYIYLYHHVFHSLILFRYVSRNVRLFPNVLI